MYSNIGEKIKTFAQVSVVFEIIACIIMAFIFFGEGEGFILIGIIILFAGPFLFLISSWVLYGFGEIIEKVTEIAKNSYKHNHNTTTTSNDMKTKTTPSSSYSRGKIIVKQIGSVKYIMFKCPKCGNSISFEEETAKSNNALQCLYCNKKINYAELT